MRFALIIWFLFACTSLLAQKRLLEKDDFRRDRLDEQWVYVKFKKSQQSASASNSSLNGTLQKIRIPQGKDPVDFCNELRKQVSIEYADPIIQYQLLATPSDPLIGNQYYLDIIKAFEAWDITKGDDDITIGIIDSGLDLDHEDLINNLWINHADPIDGLDNDNNGYVDDYYGYDFADLDNDPNIEFGNHGMIVGGIAGAATNNATGIAGLGYNIKVAALKGFRSSDGVSNGLYEAITYAAENDMDVVNLSWGRMGVPLASEQEIITNAVLNHDLVIVAAAGNEGGKVTQENKWYPASYDYVLSVGGSDQSDNKSSGSSFNHAVDLLAPGVSMYSTVKNDGYTNGGPGTSFAAPLVAATAGLVKDRFSSLSALQIMERVRVTADDVYGVGSNAAYDGKLGKGRLNVLRAVGESNIKSLRAIQPELTSVFPGRVFFGDTVNVSATLTSFLTPVYNPFITLSSPDNQFTTSEPNFTSSYIGTLDSMDIQFEIILDENLLPESIVSLRLDYSAQGYNDFQFLEVVTSPDYVDFGNEELSMTISGNGNLGLHQYAVSSVEEEGAGLVYQLDTLLKYTGFMLGTDINNVSDNIISDFATNTRNQDFSVDRYYKLSRHPAADHFGTSQFSDINRPLLIEQTNIAWEDENFLIIRYRIVNDNASPINQLTAGVFADWQLDDPDKNFAAYVAGDNYIYARNQGLSRFAGVQVLGNGTAEFCALDLDALNGNTQDLGVTFLDLYKYDFLVNQQLTSAGVEGAGNDVGTISGLTIAEIGAYDEAFINVIYAVGDSQSNLEDAFARAASRLDSLLQHPRVLETFYTCDGFEVIINPTEGTLYNFYSDPLGDQLLSASVESLQVTTSADTLLYVKNVDQNYPSDIYAVKVQLLNEIAAIEMSTDTLYLDHPTSNVVDFTDASLDATSWNWEFDHGVSSTLQHPSLSFSETGSYTVTLTVSNAQGCVDSAVKQLFVADRPTAPSFALASICPGDTVELKDPMAEKLHLYLFEEQTEPIATGSTLQIPNLMQDTTFYVSGIYGSLESTKTPIAIDVLEVHGSISYRTDTTSEEHQIVLFASNVDESSILSWQVDGNAAGSSNSITLEAIAGDIDVQLAIASSNGCTVWLKETVSISSSPNATHPEVVKCEGDSVRIVPENGEVFGFYADAALTQYLHKGTQFKTSSNESIYVVNLDDGLPGEPFEVVITVQQLEFSIAYSLSTVGAKQKIQLSVAPTTDLESYKWYLNGVLAETAENPTLFLSNASYTIVLEAISTAGCSFYDTLQLDLTPLEITDDPGFLVYPNPATDALYVTNHEFVQEVTFLSLDGREVWKIVKPEAIIPVNRLPRGWWIVRMKNEEGQTGKLVQLR